MKHLATTIQEYLNEQNSEDYKGMHSAPLKDDNAPMYDVSFMYPDMYTENALKYYGGYDLDDWAVINQIKSVHNKPKANVTVYRAVPYFNKSIDKQIKDLLYILNYRTRFRFFPKSDIVDKLEKEVWENDPKLKYDEMIDEVCVRINKMIDDLNDQKQKPVKINNGDWVTTSKLYAKQHGQSNLNNEYKVISKTVKASELYTDGNSIFEWGYNSN